MTAACDFGRAVHEVLFERVEEEPLSACEYDLDYGGGDYIYGYEDMVQARYEAADPSLEEYSERARMRESQPYLDDPPEEPMTLLEAGALERETSDELHASYVRAFPHLPWDE